MPKDVQHDFEVLSIIDEKTAKKKRKFIDLKKTCGKMKFHKIVDLRECLEKFAVIFHDGDTEDYLNQLFFKFKCEKLNKKFENLIIEVKLKLYLKF